MKATSASRNPSGKIPPSVKIIVAPPGLNYDILRGRGVILSRKAVG
jgi:hypothetical protein